MKADDIRIWNLIHDGEIEHVEEFRPGKYRLRINIPYLSNRFSPQVDSLLVYLKNGTYMTFEEWQIEAPSIHHHWREIASMGVEILSAVEDKDAVAVTTTLGLLRTDCSFESVFLDAGGDEINIDELDAQCEAYWDEWSESNKTEQDSSAGAG